MLKCAQVVLALGGDPGDLPIGLKDEQGTTRAELNQLLTRTDEIRVFEGIEVEYEECTVGSVDECYEITRDVTVFSRQGRLAELDLTDLKL